jgi:hypothetical protein
MAAPSTMNLLRSKHRTNQQRSLSVVRTQLPLALDTVANLAMYEAVPPSVTQFAQFLAHDFRHHLSTIYANAEFLGGHGMKAADKDELLREIQLAVDCMTGQLYPAFFHHFSAAG